MQKLSKISLAVVASTLLLASTSGLAANYKGEASYKDAPVVAPCVQPLMLKDGFYLGAQVGYDAYSVRVTPSVTAGAGSFSSNANLNANGFAGGAFAGYGMYWNNWYYLAGEAYVNGSGANQSSTTTATAAGTTLSAYTKVRVGTSWGVGLLPGLKVNDSTLAYVRLGYSQVSLKGNGTYSDGTTTVSGSRSNSQGGFQYGVGLETAVYPNVSVRGEYSHVSYSSFTSSSASTKFAPSNNQFMAALIYHFA